MKSSLTIDDATTRSTVAHLDHLLAEFKKDIIESQKQNYGDLLKSVDECKNKLTNYNEILGRQDELIKKQNEIIQQLQKENELLKNKFAELDARVEDQEQYSRRNTIEVFGILESQGENAENLVLDVCKELGVKITAEAISVAHRLKKFGNQRSAGIIVKFVRRKDADELLRRRKEKRNLTAQDVGFPGDKSPIFIYQSLAPGRHRLFTAARRIRAQENLRYVWIDRSGVIKMRATENSRVISIRTQQDLTAFVSDLQNKQDIKKVN
ncbi:uncharacterized protein LOC111058195 [Nilaparvata lugens]|uniref:uncharacterized protein LOC111058195 n=1 Tax=Nilaparvata lugens TaxID=108931 RepID=UPI00193D3DD8|nr:uncharacterized protein LOC111058195 [Nilaparvata lugens]